MMNATTQLPEYAAHAVAIGIGATMVMDLWLLILRALKVPALNFALLGRWVGHFRHGRWAHDSIAGAAPIRGEAWLGWLAHYATGVSFAALLLLACGREWARSPSILPALCMGVGTVVAPLFVMQPAMGAGIASSRTPTPLRNCLRSLANHAVFGVGLYLAAIAATYLMPPAY